jgi:3-phosphoshikimate 1-carboxyvinyltransferase
LGKVRAYALPVTCSDKPDWLSRSGLELVPVGPLCGVLNAPSSKSLTNRLLVIAALAEGTSQLVGLLDSDDTKAMSLGLAALGVGIGVDGEVTRVRGVAGRPVPTGQVVDAGLSGTTLRFLAAVSLLARGRVVLDGREPLRRRPIAPLLDVLVSLGAQVLSDDGRPPLRILGHGVAGGHIRVNASTSSQFATALLLVGPYATEDLVVEVEGLQQLGYVRLNLGPMSRFGALVTEEAPGYFRIRAHAPYVARAETVEHDASAAAHLYALAMATGGSITVANAFETAQPDGGLFEVLASMGASVQRGSFGTRVERRAALRGVEVDMANMPDQVPTVATLGALAQGDTVITGAGIVRGHESDRIHAVVTELANLGANVEERPDGLVIHGGAVLHPGRIETHHDHRMAMAFAAIGAVVPGVEIRDPGCVAKTYPGFFDDVARLGVEIR